MVVSVVTATGHAMAHRIIPEAEGIIFFPLDLSYLTRKILHIIKPITILLCRNRNLQISCALRNQKIFLL